MGDLPQFGVFELDLESRELRKRGMRLHLPERSFEILLMPVERPREVVTREDIHARLWPHGTVVEFEHSVNSAVRRLRDCRGGSPAHDSGTALANEGLQMPGAMVNGLARRVPAAATSAEVPA
jgi:DNA-binding response OmpR family regulator